MTARCGVIPADGTRPEEVPELLLEDGGRDGKLIPPAVGDRVIAEDEGTSIFVWALKRYAFPSPWPAGRTAARC